MPNRGVLFYCDRAQPVSALIVALWTLRQGYDGQAHIVFGPQVPDWLYRQASRNGSKLGTTIEVLETYDFPDCTSGKRGSWCQKPFAIQRSPFEQTIYFDCDHLFVDRLELDETWDTIERVGLASAHDVPSARRGRRVIQDIRTLTGMSLPSYRPVNGGCVGYRRGHESMAAWIKYMTLFARQEQSRLLRSLAEEYALGLTLNIGKGGWLDAEISRVAYPMPAAKGYHLNGARYYQNPAWQRELRYCLDADFLGIRQNYADLTRSDADLRSILVELT
jgi:hypothetical protein